MSENDQEATPLIEGQEYVATLQLTSIGGSGALKIELVKTPENFLEGDPEELIELPLSFIIMDEIVKGLIEQGDKPSIEKKPHLTVVH